MKKLLFLLSFILLSAVYSFAQKGYKPPYPFEVGGHIGTSMFLGDLGGQSGIGRPFLRDTDFKSTRLNIGLFGRWNIGRHFSTRFEMNYLRLSGDDKLSGKGAYGQFDPTVVDRTDFAWARFYRNLNFRSNVFESFVAAEITPYNFELGGGYQGYSVLSPYGFVGIGLFYHNPQGYYSDRNEWVNLKPLRTEGQGLVDGVDPYSLVQMNIPMGLGIKWNYEDQWALSFEVTHRLTFTDYMDDVSTRYVDPAILTANLPSELVAPAIAMARRSVEIDPGEVNGGNTWPGQQRGDPRDNDSYYTISVKFSYFLGNGRSFMPSSGLRSRYSCPVW
jgi:hypothetical protein